MVQEKNERRSEKVLASATRPATARRHQGLRLELLAAAERVIEKRGLAELRARDLAKEVGCSLGAIYNVVADLDELVLEVNARTLRSIGAAMAAIEETDPSLRFARLADAYLSYAASNRRRWGALFMHRMPAGSTTPGWFLELQSEVFSYIEAPLAILCPSLSAEAKLLLGRNIFAAVHGMVGLGLDELITPIEISDLRAQIALVVGAIAKGLPDMVLKTP